MYMKNKDKHQILNDVFEKRISLLKSNAPQQFLEYICSESRAFIKIKKFISEVDQTEVEKIEFILELFILISRSWEAFCIDDTANQRFETLTETFEAQIIQLLTGFQLIINQELTIQPFQTQELIDKVKEDIKLNIGVIAEILKIQITTQNVEEYFKVQQFKEFSLYKNLPFYSFSGYQGRSVFINEGRQTSPNFIIEIEWSIVEGFYFWYLNNNNPYLISSEVLVQGQYPYEELGDIYISKIYKIYIRFVSPFRMNTQDEKIQFCYRRRN